MKVSGIGQCSLDYFLVVDRYPEQDTKREVLESAVSCGGPVATALVTLSRLGLLSTFYGIIGDDCGGRNITQSLLFEKVQTTGLLTRNDSSSQTAFIVVEKGTGKRTIFWKRPSAAPLAPEELPADFPGDADFLLLDGLMVDVSLYAAKMARERGVPVMLDAGNLRAGMRELIPLCDYVVCSEEFARDIGGGVDAAYPERALECITSMGSETATVTLGDKGSVTTSGSVRFHTPAFSIQAVDTTGAGDVFHGGYIYGILKGWDLRDVVRFASACASLKCRRLGGREGIPFLEEVEEFLRNQA